MTGRNRIPVSASEFRHHHDHASPSDAQQLGERVAAQSHEIQTLLLDNQRQATTHVALKQDVADLKQDIRRLTAAASTVKSDKDSQVREVYDRYLKLETEARSVDCLSTELDRVRADIDALLAGRRELSEKLKVIDGGIARTKSELRQLSDLKAEIEQMHGEIQRGRAAIEYERKMQSHNLKLREVMERHMVSMMHEAEKLCLELANAEKGPAYSTANEEKGPACSTANEGPGYATRQINLEPGHVGYPLSDPHAIHQGPFATGSNYSMGAETQVPPIPNGVQGQQMHS